MKANEGKDKRTDGNKAKTMKVLVERTGGRPKEIRVAVKTTKTPAKEIRVPVRIIKTPAKEIRLAVKTTLVGGPRRKRAKKESQP